MRVTVKLFASLGRYLPAGQQGNAVELELPAGSTVGAVLDRLHLPRAQCHLVAVNGVHQEAGQLDARELAPGDVLAVWPPVAGG